ncbi:MAG: Calx-beta domain-containing protein, partial [Fuerstiella sp.]
TDDDVLTLSLSIDPTSVSENGGSATGTISRNDADLSSALVVTLASDDTSEATVPATVTIAAGEASATFTITAVNDDVVDGTQTAGISAAATGYTGDAASVDVTDDDVLTLTLSIDPTSVSENGGTATGTISRNDADLSAALVVTLASDDTSEATVPTTVTIPAGAAFANFTITAVDDDVVDGTQTAGISAAAAGYVGDVANLQVTDNDSDGENVPPVIVSISLSSQHGDKALPDETVTVTAAFTDGNPGDVHTATIDWGDGTITTGVVTESGGSGTVTSQHRYREPGIYVVTVTVSDGQGGVAAASAVSPITGIRLVNGTLIIVGTNLDDSVSVNIAGKNKLRVHASFLPKRGFVDFPLKDVRRIEVWLCDGDDKFHMAGNIDIPTSVRGGTGFDKVRASGRHLRFLDATRKELRRLNRHDDDQDDHNDNNDGGKSSERKNRNKGKNKKNSSQSFDAGLSESRRSWSDGFLLDHAGDIDRVFSRLVDSEHHGDGSERKKDRERWSWLF